MRAFFRSKNSGSTDPFVVKEGAFRFGRLPSVSRPDWTEDTFVAAAGGKDTLREDLGAVPWALLSVAVLVFIGLLVGRTAWLQIARGDYYYSMAEGNRIRLERLEAKRGIVYDRTGQALVRNAPNFLLYLIPADLPAEQAELSSLVEHLAVLSGASSTELLSGLMAVDRGALEAYEPYFVADNLPYDQAMELYLKSQEWPGVVLTNRIRREYNLPSLSLSHILGYTGKISREELAERRQEYLAIDYIGKMGVEYFWESSLRGQNGKREIEVDAFGKEKKILGEKASQDGESLVLSIDLDAQVKLESVLKSQLEKNDLKKGVAIALDPRNGEVIAMVSLPAYNNNWFARGLKPEEYQMIAADPDRLLFNRAVSGEYPSGSTIKPVIAAAALAEGVINENTSFLSTGGIRVGQWFFPDWRAGGHGTVNVRRALAESVNTFFYYIGGGYDDFRGLGVEKIDHWGALFGLGQQTGIDLPGEASGFLPTKEWKEAAKGEKWYIGDTYHLSIGQGDLLATPLQVAVYTAAIAEGGALYRPHLVRSLVSADEQTAKELVEGPVREGFIDPGLLEIVRQGMRQAVTSGSARRLAALPVETAGKTGTAQWSSKEKTHAWFTGFAPYDEPTIALTVLLEAGGEGSETAVPVAQEFLEWYFNDNNKDSEDKK